MNTDWNSPQGDFDTAEKQGELLMLLSRQQVTVHTWDDPDFDYMEEQDLALVVQSPSGTEDLLIELCGEFSVFFEKWHGEYAATAEGYTQLQQDITAILDGKAGALSLYTENGWQGTVLCTELPGAEDAAAVLKRCWQAAKPDAALPAGSRLELVCWDPVSAAPGGIIEQKRSLHAFVQRPFLIQFVVSFCDSPYSLRLRRPQRPVRCPALRRRGHRWGSAHRGTAG